MEFLQIGPIATKSTRNLGIAQFLYDPTGTHTTERKNGEIGGGKDGRRTIEPALAHTHPGAVS